MITKKYKPTSQKKMAIEYMKRKKPFMYLFVDPRTRWEHNIKSEIMELNEEYKPKPKPRVIFKKLSEEDGYSYMEVASYQKRKGAKIKDRSFIYIDSRFHDEIDPRFLGAHEFYHLLQYNKGKFKGLKEETPNLERGASLFATLRKRKKERLLK